MFGLRALSGGGLLSCTLLAAWLAGGVLVERARAGASNSERAADQLAAAALFLLAMVHGLGAAGALTAGRLAGVCALVGALAILGWRGRYLRVLEPLLAALGALRRPGPLWAVGLAAAWLVARMLRWPDTSWDALTYHLTYPAVWLQEQRFVRFEAGGIWDQYESFPKGGEALFFAAMAPFGSDQLVGMVNLVLWLGTGAAVKGTAQRLGCPSRVADGCAALVLLCPVLSAYVVPAYVEVPAAFAFALALNAGARAVRGDPGALAPLGVALGLAAAFKTTGLALWPFGLIAALACARTAPLAKCAIAAAWGFGLGALAAGPWYVNNAVLCGNPLYPAPLPGATAGPAAGSLASAWAIAEGSVLRQGAVGTVVEFLAEPPWRVPYPLGPGWLYLLALPGSVVLSLAFARGARARTAGVLSGLAIAWLLIYLSSPWNGVFPEANTRFLAPSLIAALLSCAVTLQGAPRWAARGGAAIGAAVVLLALLASRLVREAPGAGPAALIALSALVAVMAAVMAAATASVRLRRAAVVLALGSAACALLALPHAQSARRADRRAAFAGHAELHPIRPHAALWTRMDALPPSRVALAVGGINATEGWFFYPLLGADLRHRVRYVDIERIDRRACLRRGKLREHPDEAAWLERLRDGRYDFLVTDGDPLELRWAQAQPAAFTPVLQDGGARLFAIDRARL